MWKTVSEYEGLYEVSSDGRVRSVDRLVGGPHGARAMPGKVLRPNVRNKGGYLSVTLSKDGTRVAHYVHRLVANAFLGPCPDGLEVLHGPDGVKINAASNLSYGSHSENLLDTRRDKTSRMVKAVARSDGVEFESIAEAAEASACSPCVIGRVCKGKAKTAGGYGWRYRNLDEVQT